MRYELFLRSASPLSEQLLDEMRGVCQEMTLEPFLQGEESVGVDLGVDVEDPAAARLLLKAAFSLAEQHGLSIFDPQLGRQVTEADRELITTQVGRTTAFMQAMPVSLAGMEQSADEGISSSTRLWLMIGGLIVLAMAVSQMLTCVFAGG